MPARTITIAGLGDFRQLQTELERTGVIADKSGTTIANSSKRAGAAAAEQAKLVGLSSDQQVAAAGRAAAAFVDSQEKMSRAQKAAGTAAAEAGKAAGLSADQQVAAARRAADAQKASADAQIAASKRAADEQIVAAKRTAAATDAHSKVSKVGGVVALGAVGAAVEAVKLGAPYQTAQAAIQGATGQSVKSAGELTKAFGATAGSSMESGQQMETAYAGVAGVLKLTEGHALSTAEAMKVSSAANALAEGTGTNLAAAYGATAKVMQTFHMSASQAAEVTDTLYSTSKAVNVPVDQIASVVGKLHARLGEVAPSLRDTAGLMVALGEHGLTGGRGVMVVNTAFQTLLGGSKATDSVLKALGVSVYDSNGKFVGMQNVIAQLQPKLAGLTEQQRRYAESALFGKGATEVLGQIVKAGAPAFDQAAAAATRHGAALKAAEAQQKTFKGEMQTLKATVATLGGDLGLILIPKIQAVAKALSDSIQWLEKHKAACIALGTVITGVLGTAVAVFAYDKAVAFGKGVQRMTDGLKSLVTSSSATAASVEADQAAQSAAVEASAAKTQAANAATDASFAELGPAAVSGTAAVDGAVGTEAGAVTAADSTIEADNAAAGLSFTALLGPIAGVMAAVVLLKNPLEEVLGKGKTADQLASKVQSAGSKMEATAHNKEAQSVQEATGAVGGAPGQPTGGLPHGDKAAFAQSLAAATGLPVNFLSAWMNHEQGSSTVEGGNNWLNMETGLPGGGSGPTGASAKYAERQTPQGAAQLEAKWLKQNLPQLLKAHSATEAVQILEHSGYAESHYGNVSPSSFLSAATTTGGGSGSGTPNPAIQQQTEEASGAKPKKAASKATKTAAALGIPVGVATMLATAQALIGAPYTSGGGHGSAANDPIEMLKKIGVDCSGFVSKVLSNKTGLSSLSGLTTEGLASSPALAKGAGKYVTLYDKANAGSQSHVIADILGKWFESGGGPKGVHEMSKAEVTATLQGGGFQAMHPKADNAPVKGGLTTAKVYTQFATAEAAALKSLETGAKKLRGEGQGRGNLQSAIQSGGVPQLEKILGVSTAGKAGTTLSRVLGGYGGRDLSQRSLEGTVMPTLAKSAEGTPTGKAFDRMVAELRATHVAGMVTLANDLTQAHKQALADLGRELYAVTQEREASALTNEATEQKDRTTQTANLASKQLQVAKDSSTQVTDAMSAAAKQIDDATQIMKDSFSQMVEAVSLATQKMSDAASGEVMKTQDQTAIKVAELAERGKYGLDLIAQKLEVQLDQMKAQYDVQIDQAKMAVDQAKISGQSLIAEKQQNADLLQSHEDALVAVAQAHSDAVQVTQDQAEATAQAQLDTAQLTADIGIDTAKQTAILVASGTKAQQDKAKGWEVTEVAHGASIMAGAEAHMKAVESAANATIQAAQGALAQAQGESAQAISSAQQALAAAEGSAHIAIANAEQGLASIEGTAHVAEAGLEGKLAIERERSQTQYAGSGLVIQQYGLDYGNATAVANELTWALTHQLPV
jgi:hypothetical protein